MYSHIARNRSPTTIKEKVVDIMNQVYLGKQGRTRGLIDDAGLKLDDPKVYRAARAYFLDLLDDNYQSEERSSEKTVEQAVEQAIASFADFNQEGLDFLLKKKDRELAAKLIEKVQQTTYTDINNALNVYHILIGYKGLDKIKEYQAQRQEFEKPRKVDKSQRRKWGYFEKRRLLPVLNGAIKRDIIRIAKRFYKL